MKNLRLLIALIALMIVACVIYLGMRQSGLESSPPGQATAGKEDSPLNLPDLAIKQIIDVERARRTDLPPAFDKYAWSVRRDLNHYVYVETAVPERPHERILFRLNRRGIIVDAILRDNFNTDLNCPEKVFSESELAEIVRKARAARDDLPPLFADYRTRVARLRCLYLYFEYRLPERRGDFQTFTIDPYGELLEFSRSEPY
ncbi:MAG: hypothetical protein HY721_21610 [Planctomycetes bacterium]|nr:hypothetical protein [Planctomycetota bacterium]